MWSGWRRTRSSPHAAEATAPLRAETTASADTFLPVLRSSRKRSAAAAQSSVDVSGSTAAERELSFPCDDFLPAPDGVYFRAISIDAPPAIVFRWLCQLRAAPYSYDWLDNPGFYVGRPSPRTLTPGLGELERGQTFMTMFRLVAFEPDHHVTLLAHRFHRVFGDVAVTYMVLPAQRGCRLVVKLRGRHARGLIGRVLQLPMPWIDLVMMRRQLLNLKGLAERDAHTPGWSLADVP